MSIKINFRALIFICCYCISITISYAQDKSDSEDQKSVFSILERDRDGNYQDKDSTYIDNPIVDINSVLQINLNLGAITEQVENNTTGLPEGIGEKITKLTEALKERKKVLKTFDSLLGSYDYEAFKKSDDLNKKWAAAMQQSAISVVDLWDVSPFIESGDPNDTNVSARPGPTYKRAQIELERMTKEVEEFADTQGIYVQFGAWLYKKNNQDIALHIPGFDSIKPQTPYEVDRWRILPTKDQLTQLQEASALAQENSNQGLSVLKETIDIQVQQLEEVLTGQFNTLVDSLDTQAQQIIDDRIKPITTELKSFKDNLESFKNGIKQRVSYYEDLSINSQTSVIQVLTQIESDIDFIKLDGQELLDQASKLYNDIKTLVNSTINDIDELEKFSNKVVEYLKTWFNTTLEKTNISKIKELLAGTPVDFELLKFSDKVFKLSLKDLPKEADLDLYTAGIRQSGDRIAFKFEVATKEKTIYNENREVYMFRILPHIESTVGVIFADPIARTNVKTQFQMAPYYNLILKGLWDQKLRRTSVTYNRIFDWGIGLHISAPDFDGDDVPELGAGLVISILHDYVQTGAAINVFTGDPYWYFGLRLPIPSFNIGSIPTSSN
ncbi:hypothetical protein [Aquimarina sp. 2201CG14-23]|uniref:hypothetical protein n=1 Tax=Aquimarina mycalae TaxID=3040073 RepID=UPI002477F1F5|nr:hypothetical protein [Aquimarina sp. 2201CG14-23]MDH7445592.1 hypothetical protein [Aquimarina sp. 2201CG14-23]